MALVAESLADEWLNRQGFFTIRGVKQGVGEIDLLAVRPRDDGTFIGWHVEVQVSFRPVGYVSKRTREMDVGTGRARTSAKERTPHEIINCAKEWVVNKYRDARKVQVREQLWPGMEWAFHLIHGEVKELQELTAIESQGIRLIPFRQLLTDLCASKEGGFSASAGGDLAEVVRYYNMPVVGQVDGALASRNFRASGK
jgi:Holliday junction resolvase-like predicted endonuclease